jgi:hypothetical protein
MLGELVETGALRYSAVLLWQQRRQIAKYQIGWDPSVGTAGLLARKGSERMLDAGFRADEVRLSIARHCRARA